MIVLVFLAAYNILYIGCEILFRAFQNKELFRKIAHIGTGTITFFSTQFLGIYQYIFLFTIFIISFFLIWRFHIFRFIEEKGRWYWDIYFIIWQFICIIFLEYNRDIALSGLLILTFADGLAPIGKYIFSRKLYHDKTWWWSILFFVISSGALYHLFWWSMMIPIVAILWTIAELVGKKGSDNITIPIIITLSLTLYEKLFTL